MSSVDVILAELDENEGVPIVAIQRVVHESHLVYVLTNLKE